MKPLFDEDQKIYDIIKRYPETESVFTANGLGALVSDDGMRVLAPFLTLGTALRSRFMNIPKFVELLESSVTPEILLETPGLSSLEDQKYLTFLGLMPCGLKMPFSRAFSDFLTQLQTRNPLEIQSAVEGNLNQELSYYSYVGTIESEEELPDIIVSSDFNVFYGHRFYDRFVATGQFSGYGTFSPGKNYAQAGILDPLGAYTNVCVNPLVIVANLDQLEDRTLPTSWADLLAPQWKKSVVIRGGDQFYCHAVLLPIFQEFGESGLIALAHNISTGLHPSQMINRIDKNASGALYVMPAFFAKRIRHQERIKVIWPEDGALASPVTLQVKPSRIEELKPILDYLVGKELARILAKAGFPVPHDDVTAEVQSRPLRWLGWDYLRNNDLTSLNIQINDIFMPLAP